MPANLSIDMPPYVAVSIRLNYFIVIQKYHNTWPHEGVSDEVFGCSCSWGESKSSSMSRPLDSTAQALGNTTTWWLSWLLNCELWEFCPFQIGILTKRKRKFYKSIGCYLYDFNWYNNGGNQSNSNNIVYKYWCVVLSLFTEEVLLLLHGELCQDNPKVLDDFIIGCAALIFCIL